MKTEKLKFNGTSTDKEGMRRWFQSKHKQVNQIIANFEVIASVVLSKSAHSEMVERTERILGLEISGTEESLKKKPVKHYELKKFDQKCPVIKEVLKDRLDHIKKNPKIWISKFLKGVIIVIKESV